MSGTMMRWELDAVGRRNLHLRDTPVPVPGPGEVLVRVGSVALNYRDRMVLETGRGLPLDFPFTPGSDLAGLVVEVGQGASRFAVGDRVISNFTPDWIDGRRPGDARTPAYRTLGGFYPGVLAEYVAMPDGWLVAAPTSLDDCQACTLPCAGLTAWFALVERGRVRAGDVVLIDSTGGVALFGLQLAKASGCEVIVVGSAGKAKNTLDLGADHFVARTRGDGSWIERVLELTGNRGADHVLEVVGGRYFGLAAQVVAVGDHISQIGAQDGFELSGPVMPLHGIGTGSRAALERLVLAVDANAIKPVIDSRYDLSDLGLALERLDQGPFGKIVIDVGERR